MKAMVLQQHDLPAGMTEWVESVGDGTITRLERHVASREAWVVDITRADDSVLEGFLRLERHGRPGNPWSLALRCTGRWKPNGLMSSPSPKMAWTT